MHSELSLASTSPIAVSSPGNVILFSYWRSSCSWRVRIALHFKGIPFEYREVNLLQNSQKDAEYASLNPGCVVPTLVIDNIVINQSLAILEYLEERRPETWRLMPMDPFKRAQVRTIVQLIVSDTQPLQNLRVLQYVGEQKLEWAKHWITLGLAGKTKKWIDFTRAAVEKMLADTAGRYCVGDEVTLADVCLVPQVYNARRFHVDLTAMPIIARVEEALSKLEPFQKAHPDLQPDASR